MCNSGKQTPLKMNASRITSYLAMFALIGVLLSQIEVAGATSARAQAERVDMPVHRARAFVPRIGKRQDFALETTNFGDPITSMEAPLPDGGGPSDMGILLSLLGSLRRANTISNNNNRQMYRESSNLDREENAPSDLDLYRRLYSMNTGAPRREPTSYFVNPELIDTIIGESGSSSVKRVPFTPRIG